MKVVKIGNIEVSFFTFSEYCQAYKYVKKEDCNVRTYIKYIIAKLIAEKIFDISPLDVYIVYKLVEKGKARVSPLELLKDIVFDVVRIRRHYNGMVTPTLVEKVVKELQREVLKHGKDEVLRKYLPEKWY